VDSPREQEVRGAVVRAGRHEGADRIDLFDQVCVEARGGWAVGDDAASVHDNNPVARARGEVQDVQGHDDAWWTRRRAGRGFVVTRVRSSWGRRLVSQFPQESDELDLVPQIKVVGGFVEQKVRGPLRQCPGKEGPLAFAARESQK